MAVYSNQYAYPTPYYGSPSYHQASVYPHLYSASTYSLPAVANYDRHSRVYELSPHNNMPTYYVQSTGTHRSHRDPHTSRRSSSSHHRSGTGHSQPVVYTTSGSTHQRDYAYSTPSRHHRSASVGYRDGGNYYQPTYTTQSYGGGYGYNGGQYYVPTTSGHHRSSSRHHSPQVVDLRHGQGYSTSGGGHNRRHSVSYVDAGHHSGGQRYYYDTHEDFGDRVRRWFGLSPSGHHHRSHSTTREAEYVDARTGRPVSRNGRPIYRV